MRTVPLHRHVGGRTYGPTARFAVVNYTEVDDHNYDRLVSMGMWMEHTKRTGPRYARLQGTGGANGIPVVFMHHVVGGFGYDHINGDGLNNLESNLRPASLSEAANQRLNRDSTTGEPGVSWHKRSGKYQVRVKSMYFGLFSDKAEAVQVSRQRRKELYGELVRGKRTVKAVSTTF